MTHWSLRLFVVGSDAPNYCDLSDQTHKQTSIYSYKLHFVLNVRCQILAPRPQNPV